jgi:hypothetical protein
MPSYNYSSILKHPVKRKKAKRGRGILLCVLLLIAAGLAIAFALNYRTILLTTGNGSAKLNDVQTIKKTLAKSSAMKNIKSKTNKNGDTTLTGTSKNGAVNYKVTQKKSGQETVAAKVDVNKLQSKAVNIKQFNVGDMTAITSLQRQADEYIAPIVGKDAAPGIELYFTKEIIAQSAKNPQSINILHTFGDVSVQLSGDLYSRLTLKITK